VSGRQHWEYRLTATMPEGDLNTLGREGWELVAALQTFQVGDRGVPNHPRLYWKRLADLPTPLPEKKT
jgi:hypothetical protein